MSLNFQNPLNQYFSQENLQFLTNDERRQLTRLLADLPVIQTSGPEGRKGFLNENGLAHLATELPMFFDARTFAGVLVSIAEGETWVDQRNFQALGALCDGILKIDDSPRANRPFLAQLLLQYRLVEDDNYLTQIRDEFGDVDKVTPWREQQKQTARVWKPIFTPTPTPRLGGIVGRDNEMIWLKNQLLKEGIAAIAGIRGVGGIGKTELAKALANELRGHFEGRVIWLECGEKDIYSIQTLLAAEIGLRLLDDDETLRANVIKQRLSTLPPILIILDDLRSLHKSHFSLLSPPTPPCALLVTTRHMGLLPDIATRLLEELDDEAAGKLLDQEFGDQVSLNDNQGTAQEIIMLLENVPLAIILAGRWVQKILQRKIKPNNPLDALLKTLQQQKTIVLDQDPTKKDLSLRITFNISYNELELDDQRRVRQLGIFARKQFSLLGLQQVWGDDEKEARLAILKLETAGIIQEYDTDVWWMHDIHREYARQHLEQDSGEFSETAQRQVAFVINLLNNLNLMGMDSWEALGSFQPEIEKSGKWLEQNWKENPSLAIKLAYLIGDKHYVDISDVSIGWLQAGLEAARFLGNQLHEAAISSSLASKLTTRGRYKESKQLYLLSLEFFERLQDKSNVAVVQGWLADLLEKIGDYEEAENLYRKSLASRIEVGNLQQIVLGKSSLATVLIIRGAYPEAQTLLEESLLAARQAGDVRQIAVIQTYIASIFEIQGQYEQAENLYREGVKVAEDLKDKNGIMVVKKSLGDLLLRRGKYSDAEKEYLFSLDIAMQLEDHYNIAATHKGLGDVYFGKGKFKEAEEKYRQTLMAVKQLGVSQAIASAQLSLSELLTEQNINDKEAEELVQESIKVFEHLGNPNELARGYSSLGLIFMNRGEHNEAEKLFNSAMELSQSVNDRQGTTQQKLNLGHLALIRADWTTAQQLLSQSREEFITLGLPQWVIRVDKLLAVLQTTLVFFDSIFKLVQEAKRGNIQARSQALKKCNTLCKHPNPIFVAIGNSLRKVLFGLSPKAALRDLPERLQEYLLNSL